METTQKQIVLGILAHAAGIIDRPESVSAAELAKEFSWDKIKGEAIYLQSTQIY